MDRRTPILKRPRVLPSVRWKRCGNFHLAHIRAERGASFDLSPSHGTIGGVAFLLQLAGTANCEQHERCIHLGPSQWDVFATQTLKITSLALATEQCAVMIPGNCLHGSIDRMQLAERRPPGTTGISKLLGSMAFWIFQSLDIQPTGCVRLFDADDTDRATRLGRVLGEWLTLAIEERLHGAQPFASTREILRRRALDYIDANLHEPHISVQHIADHLCRSPVYVQQLFRELGLPPSKYILSQRLNSCYVDLLDPRLGNLTVTEIAVAWGFNSLPHFSSTFSNHFGRTPTEVRAECQRSDAPAQRQKQS
jgi:AraC-like DNA-binding protein